ncbi:MAG TPA: lipopolysaccharide biosynthesis protein [Cellvibrio sp.]
MGLKQQLTNSTAWMSLAASGMSIVSFLVFIIISRILSPTEIGLAVFAILVVEAGKIILNGGISQAIVKRADWNHEYASSCFYLNIFYALVFTAVVWFAGSPLTARYYDPAAVPVLQALVVIFLLEGIKVVHEGKLRREFAFKVIAVRSISASLLSGIIGVVMALQGYGVWALVAQQLSGQLLVTVVTLVSARWWPEFKFVWHHSKHALKFSSPLMLAQLINTLCSSVLEFMVGILLGPAALGIYRIGGRALFILQDIIVRPLEQTALPALARLHDLSARASACLRIMRMSSFIIVPIFFGTAAIAPEFIVLVFGEKWRASGELMSLIAVGSAPLLIRYQVNAALTAQGKTLWVLGLTLSLLIATVALGYFWVSKGLIYAALAYVATTYFAAILGLIIFQSHFGCSFAVIIKTLLPSYIASATMLGICWATKNQLGNLPLSLQIPLIALVGALSYLLLGLLVFRPETKNFLQEALSIAPAKVSPHLLRLQHWLGFN